MKDKFSHLLLLCFVFHCFPAGADGRGIYITYLQSISPTSSSITLQNAEDKGPFFIKLAQQRLRKKSLFSNYSLTSREKKVVQFWELYLSEEYTKAAKKVTDDILDGYTLYAACRSLYIVDDNKKLSYYLNRFQNIASTDPLIKMVVLMVRAYSQDDLNKSEKTELLKRADSILVNNNFSHFKYCIQRLYGRNAPSRTQAIQLYNNQHQ